MENLEYIDDFFKSSPTAEQKKEFDQKIISDHAFAENVAIYFSANEAARELVATEKKENFRRLYSQAAPIETVSSKTPVRNLWRYAAAAAILISIVLIKTLIFTTDSPAELATKYEVEHFKDLRDLSMGVKDSIQYGLDLYNHGKSSEAIQLFENILSRDNNAMDVRKYAGIIYLETNQYDKALEYFKILSAQKAYYNPGFFYQAITLLKRNAPGDKLQAKALLEKIVSENLDGKKEAQEWLKHW